MGEIPYSAYVLLWVGIIIAVPIVVVAALIQVWNAREKRDGKK